MDFLMTQAMKSWRDLNKMIGTLTEEQLKGLLIHELNNGKRKATAKRIHQRLGIVRQEREWKEIEDSIQAQRGD